jgi:SAM-dependent methyltransferase
VISPGRRLLHVLRPPGDRRGDERGRCSVCGAETRFALNSWLVPPTAAAEWGPEWVAPFARRETLLCGHCSSSLRVRRLAEVLLEHYAAGATSVAALVEEPGFRALDVAEINSVGTMHAYLAGLPGLRHSEYGDGGEDIQALSYADASFDLVLTSETLEHVPDWRLAVAETHRVLRPGGRHVFTVPLVPTRERTEDVSGHGWHHARGTGVFRLVGPRGDMLVHTVFGRDLLDEVRTAGFEPELHFEGEAASVVCARKAGGQ